MTDNMRKWRQEPKQPAADYSNATPRAQTSQSEAILSKQHRTTIAPQSTQSMSQQQPQRSGPVTRSSDLAPIEKKREQAFSREEARKRSSSLGAPSKGKKTTRKTETQLLAPSTQEVGLEEVLQVAPVRLQILTLTRPQERRPQLETGLKLRCPVTKTPMTQTTPWKTSPRVSVRQPLCNFGKAHTAAETTKPPTAERALRSAKETKWNSFFRRTV